MRKGHWVKSHNAARDTIWDLASTARMGSEREPIIGHLVGATTAQRADLQITEKGVVSLYDITIVGLSRMTGAKHPRFAGYEDKRKRYKVINSSNGHMKVKPLVLDAVGGCCRVTAGLLDRIGLMLEPSLPPGALDWSRPTGAVYVRAKVATDMLIARHKALLELRRMARPVVGGHSHAQANLGMAATE